MKIVYQAPNYHQQRVYGIAARKISDDTLIILESDISFKLIRKYEIVAPQLIATKEFDDDVLHALTFRQITTINRIITINDILADV